MVYIWMCIAPKYAQMVFELPVFTVFTKMSERSFRHSYLEQESRGVYGTADKKSMKLRMNR